MSRRSRQNEIGVGQDSFLDVVSNIVGILIILVVIVGSQITSWDSEEGEAATLPDASISQKNDFSEHDISRAEAERAAFVLQHAREMDRVNSELQEIEEQKKILIARMETLRRQDLQLESEINFSVEEKRKASETLSSLQRELKKLSETETLKNQEFLAAQQRILKYEDEIRRSQELLVEAETAVKGKNGGPMKIEHKMTPILRNVSTQETHFILKEGKVLYIPMDELIEIYKRRTKEATGTLLTSGQKNDIIGPINGFSLHVKTIITGKPFLDVYWTLETPSISQFGEAPEFALREMSAFKSRLSGLNPRNNIITLWVYPDSFGEFTVLKEELYRLGFLVASRPLPQNVPISASPEGKKSLAQ
ncbi:MAG: hypothetical protein Q4C96_08835 [Planctomycetia bacterium]|nr:hypothetical protein [Planctomycetia bacterium]